MSYAPLVKRAAPAVVNIYTAKKVMVRTASPLMADPLFGQLFGENSPFMGGRLKEKVVTSLGSGVIIHPDGLIVTNNHVIKGAEEIKIVLSDRREFSAKSVLIDQRSDLALLRIENAKENLPYLEFSDSDALEVGDMVLAIGNPFGIGQTVTSGIVSALARTTVGINDYEFFIQTDAAINPGNSGGALVDMEGNLVGINTAIFSKSGGSMGIGFATPSVMVKVVMESYLNGGKKVIRPWLGAATQNVTREIAESLGMKKPSGVLIKSVYPGSAAEKSGLMRGDVVISVDGKEIQDEQSLKFLIATYEIGKSAEFLILRKGMEGKVVIPMEVPKEYPRNKKIITGNSPISGVIVETLSPALAEELGIDDIKGVIVSGAEQGSIATRLVKNGDIIEAVNKVAVKDAQQLQELLDSLSGGWHITVRRGNKKFNISVRQ